MDRKTFWGNEYIYLAILVVILTVALSVFSVVQLKISANKSQWYNKKILIQGKNLVSKTIYLAGQKASQLNYSDLPAESIILIYPTPDMTYRGADMLASWDNAERFFEIDRPLDLNDYLYIELDLDWRTSANPNSDLPGAIQSLKLQFGDEAMKHYYEYPIFNLVSGRNLIRIAKDQFILSNPGENFNWSKIRKARLALISRPGASAQVAINRIEAEQRAPYLDDWLVRDNLFFSLSKDSFDKIRLTAQHIGAPVAIWKKAGNVQNFTFQAQISPQKTGRSGLFFRGDYQGGQGYYFYIGGRGSNAWELDKYGKEGFTTLATGELKYNYFRADTPYWLRVEAKGTQLSGFLSFDGLNFTKVAQVQDDAFNAGGIGVAVADSSEAFFDEFKFWQ